jgi:hypothetical protein
MAHKGLKNKKAHLTTGHFSFETNGSPTWTRNGDLRITSTGHTPNSGSEVEDTEQVFFDGVNYTQFTELFPNL